MDITTSWLKKRKRKKCIFFHILIKRGVIIIFLSPFNYISSNFNFHAFKVKLKGGLPHGGESIRPFVHAMKSCISIIHFRLHDEALCKISPGCNVGQLRDAITWFNTSGWLFSSFDSTISCGSWMQRRLVSCEGFGSVRRRVTLKWEPCWVKLPICKPL